MTEHTHTVKVRQAAIYECGEWSARIEEDDEFIRLFWKDQPWPVLPGTDLSKDSNAWSRDVLEPLAIVIHTALQASLRHYNEAVARVKE